MRKWILLLAALVSLNAAEQPLRTVVAQMEAQTGARFFLPERLADRKVTVSVQQVPIEEAVDAVAKAAGVRARPGRQKGVFVLTDR